MSVRSKVASLERKMGEAFRRCPRCFGMGLMDYSTYYLGEESPPPTQPDCPVCGREPFIIRFVFPGCGRQETYDPEPLSRE